MEHDHWKSMKSDTNDADSDHKFIQIYIVLRVCKSFTNDTLDIVYKHLDGNIGQTPHKSSHAYIKTGEKKEMQQQTF